MIKVSVIMPIYNGEKFLEKAVKMALDQTLNEIEIILVDDGSTDNSGAICDALAENNPKIKVFHKENGGAGSARNLGIENASGKYLYFPDCDDYFDKNLLKDLYELGEKNDADVVYSGINYVDALFEETGKINSSVTREKVVVIGKEQCRKYALTLFPTTTYFDVPWNKIYKTQTVKDNGVRYRNLRRVQDACFNLDFYNFVEKLAVTDKIYYNYFENDLANTYKKFPKDYYKIILTYNGLLREYLIAWGIYEEVKLHYNSSLVLGLYASFGMLDNPKFNLNKKGKIEYIQNILNEKETIFLLKGIEVKDSEVKLLTLMQNKNARGVYKLIRKAKRLEKFKSNKFVRKIVNILRGKK